jgi:hypothetical protein
MQFAQLLELKQMGIPVPTNILLETSTLYHKKDLIDAITAQEKSQAQMQQQQEMMNLEQQRILTRSLEAKAQSDFASAEQKKADIIDTLTTARQRASATVANEALSAIELVKSSAELSDIMPNRLLKTAKFVMDIEKHQKELAEREEMVAQRQAAFLNEEMDEEMEKTEQKGQQQESESFQQETEEQPAEMLG